MKVLIVGTVALAGATIGLPLVRANSTSTLVLTPVKEGWSRHEVAEFNRALGLTGISHLEGHELIGSPYEPKIVIVRTNAPEFCIRNACLTSAAYRNGESVSRILFYSKGVLKLWSDRLPGTHKNISVVEFEAESFTGRSKGQILLVDGRFIAWGM